MLPGMMCDARLWTHQMRDLEADCQVPSLAGSSQLQTLAERILENAPDRFAVAGLSMGGIVAFELWRQAPERITHLALIDTNPFAETPERQSLRLEQIEFALQGGLRKLATESLKPLYLAEANRDDDKLLDTILDMALDLGPEVFREQSLALRDRPDSASLLPAIDVPTTVICGAEDALCPVHYHEFMATQIPGARLVVIDNCGHLASMEQPDAVTHELRNLLRIDPVHGKNYANQPESNTHNACR